MLDSTNIIEYQDRPFHTTDEMDAVLIENWNRVVAPEDQVFLLGDISLHNPKTTREILDQLHGKITLVLGNHDDRQIMEKTRRFELVSPFPILFDAFFLLSHEPIFVNERCPFCNVHGHTHSNTFMDTALHVNVSAECVNYTPKSYEEIKKQVKARLERYNRIRQEANEKT